MSLTRKVTTIPGILLGLLWTSIIVLHHVPADSFQVHFLLASSRLQGPSWGTDSLETGVLRRCRASALSRRPLDQNTDERRPSIVASAEQHGLLHKTRTAAASSLLGLALFFSPMYDNTLTNPFGIPSAYGAAGTTSMLLEAPQKTLISSAVGTPEGTTAGTIPNDIVKAVNPQPKTVVDEVWSLVNKYYIDRSFNNQDWEAVKQKYDKMQPKRLDNDASMRMATEMVKSLDDKFSRMLDVKQYAAIQKFDLIGVGVTLMPNERKEIVVGAPPVAGSASAKAGLQVGDQVVAVNGIQTEGRTAFDIIDQISENPTSKTVTMTVKSQDARNANEITMERTFAEVKDPIQFKVSETRSDGTKVGFIRIAEFNSLVKARLEEALKDLRQQQVTALVLDLRGNPGGAFQSAVEISSLFVDNRVATYVVDSNKVELPLRTGSGQLAVEPKIPIAIWLDGRSASASEVLAGSLHDNCRAVVMGEKSFGKGLIQAVYGLKNGAGLVLTVARYVTPNGTEIQGAGIEPDISEGVPLFFPGLSTDSSRVDFADISRRLDPAMCTVPNN